MGGLIKHGKMLEFAKETLCDTVKFIVVNWWLIFLWLIAYYNGTPNIFTCAIMWVWDMPCVVSESGSLFFLILYFLFYGCAIYKNLINVSTANIKFVFVLIIAQRSPECIMIAEMLIWNFVKISSYYFHFKIKPDAQLD